jgi:hypothetical protein
MNQKEFAEALVRPADSDAADKKPKRDADSEAELLRDAFVTFSHCHYFKPGMIVREKAGCSLLQRAATCFSSYWYCAMMDRRLMSKRVTGPLGSGCRWICWSIRTRTATSSLCVALGRSTGHSRKVDDIAVGRWQANRKSCLALY